MTRRLRIHLDHLFADAEQRHCFGLRVENLFDMDYATRIRSAVLTGSSPATRFMYRNLGPSRTALLNYTCNLQEECCCDRSCWSTATLPSRWACWWPCGACRAS